MATLREDFERHDIHLNIEHVRTRDLWRKLDAKKVDMVCGSFAAQPGRPPELDYDFLEWHRERVALLTNLTTRELPDTPVTAAKLPTLPLLAPTAGLLAQFLSRVYGPDYRGTLDRAERDRYAADQPLNLLWGAFAAGSPARSVPSALPG